MTLNRGMRSIPGNSRSDVLDWQDCGVGLLANRPLPRHPGRLFFATDNQTLYMDSGSAWLTQKSASMLAHSEVQGSVTNTTAETDMWNFNVPANSLTVGDRLRLKSTGSCINNSGAGITYTYKFYVAGTLILTSTAVAVGNSANRQPHHFEAMLQVQALSGANTVVFGTLIGLSGTGAVDNTMTAASYHFYGGTPNATPATADWSTAVGLRFTCTMGTASPVADDRWNGYSLERLPA